MERLWDDTDQEVAGPLLDGLGPIGRRAGLWAAVVLQVE